MERSESNLEIAHRQELARFLRARRAALQPADVDLCPPAGRRNTPGLRREEVAQISGVGVTWYTWLEQARPVTVTGHVIDALANAFRLDRDTHRHLRQLVRLPVPEADQMPEAATAELTRLLNAMAPAPACIFGLRFDYLAWNDTYGQMWHPEALPPSRRNVLWLAFCDPSLRQSMVNWGERCRSLVRQFRAAAGQHAGDTRFVELITALSETSPEFRNWWDAYDAGGSIAGPVTIRHPHAGTIQFDVNELRICGYPSLTLSVHVPRRPADRARLEALTSSNGSTQPPGAA